jgi:hypothetical protein
MFKDEKRKMQKPKQPKSEVRFKQLTHGADLTNGG